MLGRRRALGIQAEQRVTLPPSKTRVLVVSHQANVVGGATKRKKKPANLAELADGALRLEYLALPQPVAAGLRA